MVFSSPTTTQRASVTVRRYSAPADGRGSVAMQHFENQLLSMFAPADFERIRPHLAVTNLELGTVLAEPKQIIERVYFPHSGIISFVVPLSDGPAVERDDPAVGKIH